MIKKEKILLLQGENGRKLIEENLKKKGFKVSVIECYKRVIRNLDVKEFKKLEKKWRSYQINTLVITSSEILYHLNKIICSINKNHWIFSCKMFVVSKRLFKIAKNLGWKDIIIAKYASNEFLLKIIKKISFNH